MDTHSPEEIEKLVNKIARDAREASFVLSTLPTEKKNAVLYSLADLIVENEAHLLEENHKDIVAAEANELAPAMVDRLRFSPERIRGMAEGVKQVAELEDPVGRELEKVARPNGLDIRKVSVPIGVIGIIYESRPNVTIDCAVLCLKSGNASILRGGREAFHSNMALAELISQALEKNGVTRNAVQLIPTTDRYALKVMLQLDNYIHCVIPRGGESLIRFVAETAYMPVIKHYKGVCNLYIDADADLEMALDVAMNAKVQRPSVCNAIENLIVDKAVADKFLPVVGKALQEKNVELRVDLASAEILTGAGIANVPATEEDYFTEYTDYILSIKVVEGVSEAISFVNHYGSGHSESIVTKNEAHAKAFMGGVDSATIYWNASTRFTDGFEFGLGAEIGISTDRLHARGPMGLRELCTYKYLIYGTGQVR